MKVAVVRTDSRIVYEWRIELGAALDPDRAIGFDVSVADKDKDGSFSWAAWGSGTQKIETPDRCGEFLLVSPGTRFGEVSGLVAWKDPSPSALPSRVRIQSARSAPLWREALVDSSGAYKASTLPVGPYSVPPWIRRTSASMRSRASTSRSRPIGRRKPTSSASPPSPGPG